MFKKWFKIYFLFAALVMLALTGCKKWLDVDVPLQVDQSTVYSNEQGFREISSYLPMQNVEKILVSMSSVVVSPVI